MTSDTVIQLAKSTLSGLRRKILCVDDDPDTIELLLFSLGQDYAVSSAADTQSAYRLIENESFDLFILDTRLPDGTGIDLLHKIQGSSPNTPVIFVSADARPSIRQEAVTAGAQEYVLKPIDWNLLKDVIQRLLDQAESNSLNALEEECRVTREELQMRCRTAGAQTALAKSRFDSPQEEEQFRIKARRGFLRSGGTRALFERLWPSVYSHVVKTLGKPKGNKPHTPNHLT